MPNAPTAEFVAETLSGHWRLGATSLPEWLDGERQSVLGQQPEQRRDARVQLAQSGQLAQARLIGSHCVSIALSGTM